MASGTRKSVITAVAANSLVTVAKLVAWVFSGSGAMLSEAIHSLADTTNQALLLFGLERSTKAPDSLHPEGYGRARFFWGLVSALGIFFLGAGVTLWHGVHGLSHPEPSTHGWITWAVLIFAAVLEGGAFAVAWRGVAKDAAKVDLTTWEYSRQGRDPTAAGVLLEDGAAVLGLGFAAAGIGLERWTGWAGWDGIASILIGVLLGLVAIFLVAANRKYLLGVTIDPRLLDRIRDQLEAHPSVEGVHAVRGMVVTLGRYRISAELEFEGGVVAQPVLDGLDLGPVLEGFEDEASARAWLEGFADAVVDSLGDEVDALERDVRERVPGAAFLDLEAD